MGAGFEVSVRDLKGELERRSAALVRSVAQACDHHSTIAKQLREMFYDAVGDIDTVSIGNIAPDSGAFVIKGPVMHVSEEPTARLLYAVIDDLRTTGANTAPLVDPLDLMERVFGTFVLHELRHRTQGIGSFPVVGQVKKVAGPMALAEFDAIADRDAAFAYAAVKAPDASRTEFLEALQEALFLSSAYYFRVFPISGARPDKVARALGVLLMTARLASVKFGSQLKEDPKLPLDATLVAHLSTDMSSLVIFRPEPHRQVLGVANDDDGELTGIVADIEAGKFDSALARCVVLLRRLRIIRPQQA